MPRGREGESRYKNKRRTMISLEEFETSLNNLNLLVWKSLIVLLFYAGFRISEIIGDQKRKWKILSATGRALQRQNKLPLNWIKTDLSQNLWIWRNRGKLPGIVKEDISLEGTRLTIFSEPLKHGKREGEGIELSTTYPYVDLIVDQWRKTEPSKKVWDVSRWKMKNMFKEIGIYPHAYRFSRATRYAHDPDMSIADMQEWFGWARGTTADGYIVPVRSVAKSLRSIEKELDQREK